MKTIEFKKEIKKLGFLIEVVDDEDLYINDKYGSTSLASVSTEMSYCMGIYFEEYPSLLNSFEKRCLFDLITRYASTSIVEREEEKHYTLELISKTITEKCYMGYKSKNDEFKPITLNYLNFSRENEDSWRIIFKESELEKMDLTGFKKVETTEWKLTQEEGKIKLTQANL